MQILNVIFDSRLVKHLLVKTYERLYSVYLDDKNIKLRQKYQIHSTVIWHPTTQLHGAGMITIGEATYIGANSMIDANPSGARIEIGKFCAISHNVDMRTIEYKTNIHFYNARMSDRKFSNIKINDYVWIGANVFISGGVEIGENSVIGANSVVTHDIPPHSICVGVPARVLRMKPESARTISVQVDDENDSAEFPDQ